MPSISVSDEDKIFIEKLRTQITKTSVPSQKRVLELIIDYAKKHDGDFLKWVEREE
jgi:hypothetical protein